MKDRRVWSRELGKGEAGGKHVKGWKWPFPVTDHKLGCLKQQKFILLVPEAKTLKSNCLFLEAQEENLLHVFLLASSGCTQFWVFPSLL